MQFCQCFWGGRPIWTALVSIGLVWAGPARAGTPPLPVIPATNFVVTAFGAVGDGLTNNATAIQNTINAASAAGGGTVEIPANGTLSTYLSGPINLASSINLQIDAGAMLQMLPRNAVTNGLIVIPSWPNASIPFISGATVHNVEISGSGTLDGQGTNWWFPKASTRPNFIQFTSSTTVLIQGVTLQNPPTFHIMVHNNNVGLTIQNITINTPGSSPNTDGIDLASTNVLIQGCSISDGDDNIQLGSSAAATVDITISNCTFGAGHGLSIGSGTEVGVQNMVVSNCTFNGTRYGIHMKSDRGIGGLVQNLQYLDITMTNVAYPIAMYSYYNELGAPSSINVSPFMASTDTVHAITSTTPIWYNITISNLTTTVTTGKNVAGIIWGLPEMLFSNITLCDVNFSAATNTFAIYNAQGVQIVDSQLSSTGGTNALTLFNAQITVTNSAASTNLVTLGGLATSQGSNTLAFFNAQAAVTDTNMLGTSSITLGTGTLTFTQDSAGVADNFSIIGNGTLVLTSGTNSFYGILGGSGSLTLNLIGGSSLALQGDSTAFNGPLTISNGTLFVDNTTGNGTGTGAVTIADTATLGGDGVIAGPVTVEGALMPGLNGPGVLTISNNLVLNGSSVATCFLGSNSSLAIVTGDLALNGTLNVVDAGGFNYGSYALFNYTGMLTTNGSPSILAIGSVPNTNLVYSIDISSNGYVRLLVSPPPPMVTLTSPALGIIDNTITLSATATDYVSIVKVEFYRDNGVLLGTVTSPPYSLAFNTTTVDDGAHCFYAEAYDPVNNVANSATNCVIVDNLPPTVPADVTAAGIATNQIYLSWAPSTDTGAGVAGYHVIRGGSLFANTTSPNYTDSGLSTATRYCYTVAAFDNFGHVSAGAEVCGQTLGPANSVQGVYNGLVLQTNAPSYASSGSIQVTVTKSLSFAARLVIGGAHVSFGGFFDSSGNSLNTVVLPGKDSLQVALHTLPDGTDQITGTASNSEFTSDVLADRATFDSRNPCPFAGHYTMVLEPPTGNDPTIPQGFGYGTMTVAATGLGRIQGVLGDGARINAIVPISKRATLPFYAPLYSNQGAAVGWLTFATNSTIQATMDWFRPAIFTSALYPNGFATNVTLAGEEFVPPADNGPDPSGTRQVTLTGGNLVGSLVETAVVNSAGTVSVPSPNTVNLQMKLNPSTGLFSGSFIHPVLNKTVNFNGSSLQLDGAGAGLFVGSNETGSVVLELVP